MVPGVGLGRGVTEEMAASTRRELGPAEGYSRFKSLAVAIA